VDNMSVCLVVVKRTVHSFTFFFLSVVLNGWKTDDYDIVV
jgi:hypothetical protein